MSVLTDGELWKALYAKERQNRNMWVGPEQLTDEFRDVTALRKPWKVVFKDAFHRYEDVGIGETSC